MESQKQFSRSKVILYKYITLFIIQSYGEKEILFQTFLLIIGEIIKISYACYI